MDKNVSIVKVDKRHYRVIAQENWGLTNEQMRGKHVHHRIRRSDGGTNDPSNLYVCSPWYHDVVWHGGSGGFIELASEAGKKGGASIHIEKDELGRSIHGVRAMEKVHAEKDARLSEHHYKHYGGKSCYSSNRDRIYSPTDARAGEGRCNRRFQIERAVGNHTGQNERHQNVENRADDDR
jgi:hypothetical protein